MILLATTLLVQFRFGYYQKRALTFFWLISSHDYYFKMYNLSVGMYNEIKKAYVLDE